MRNGEIVGRIGAIHSRKANDKWGANRLRFTKVDFIDDPEVSSALFRTVEALSLIHIYVLYRALQRPPQKLPCQLTEVLRLIAGIQCQCAVFTLGQRTPV